MAIKQQEAANSLPNEALIHNSALSAIYAASVEALSPATLYLVAVPIGNLADISLRALAVLQNVDWVACEDTRTTALLLSHYQLRQPLFSLHAHNERERIDYLANLLAAGKKVALVSDAGYPLLSDPGALVTKALAALGYKIEVVPGANAALVGLLGSALDPTKFIFLGFLPKKGKERQHYLQQIANSAVTSIVYESPLRVASLLTELVELGMAERQVCLARELTKRYETYLRLPLAELLQQVKTQPPKGECVLIFAAASSAEQQTMCPATTSLDLSQLEAEIAQLWHDESLTYQSCLAKLAAQQVNVAREIWLCLLLNQLKGLKSKANVKQVAAQYPQYTKHALYKLLLALQAVLEA